MKDLITQFIERIVSGQASSGSAAKTWRSAIVGFARADDPLFERLKRSAHQGHLLPTDLLAGARSVIVYFLAFRETIMDGNVSGDAPSTAWAAAYQETNNLITLINTELESFLQSRGYRCGTIPATHNFDAESLLSPWSHRHAAHIAGLGTFGLNRMLITQMGCGGRIGSMVTELELAPSQGPGQENCLYLHDGSCGVCIERCPCGALTHDGFDRRRCYERLLENEKGLNLEGRADVCGKCCCGLPCSSRNPVERSPA